MKDPRPRRTGQRHRGERETPVAPARPRRRPPRVTSTRPRATSTRRCRPRRSWPSPRSAPSTPTRTTPRAGTGSPRTPPTCLEPGPRAPDPAALVGPRQLRARQPRPGAEPAGGRAAGHGRRVARRRPRPAAGLILARLEVDYLRQLHYRVGEQVCVRSWVTRSARSRSRAAGTGAGRRGRHPRSTPSSCIFDVTDRRHAADDRRRSARYWGAVPGGVSQPRISSVQHLTLPPALSSSQRSTPTGT